MPSSASVGDVVPGHKLVIDLSERQVIALGGVLLNNRVDDGNEAGLFTFTHICHTQTQRLLVLP